MLRVKNLVKKYDEFTLDCSLELRPGSITGLIGANGAGKSTTFKAILGLIRMDGGSVELLGKDIKEFTAEDKQNLGVAMSDSGFSTYLTVRDITYILKAMYKRYDNEKFLAWCQQFNLPTNKKIKEFSTGMKAKLKLLVAMSHEAKLLILDEPTVGLDVMAREELLGMMQDYMEEDESRSILISSHISSDLEGLCDDFYMIHNGEIVLHEETDVLLSNYALLKADSAQFEKLEKDYIVKYKKESWGYSCLTNQKRFYMENYPELVVEKGNLDALIVMMAGGDEL